MKKPFSSVLAALLLLCSLTLVTPVGADGSVYLIDGRYTAFVDTTGQTKTYTLDGKSYGVYSSMTAAINAYAERIYYIRGRNNLSLFSSNNYKQSLEFIGVDRKNAVFEYSANLSLVGNLTFRNLTLDKTATGDTGLTLKGHTLTLDSVKSLSNPLRIFNTAWGAGDPSGSLVVTGDTGDIEYFFPGPNYSATAYSKGDVTLVVEGGNFTGDVGIAKNAAVENGGNRIDGNVYYDISGGTFDAAVKAPTENPKTNVTKNVVIRISGGTFNGTIGHTGTSYVGGKEVYIFDKEVYDNYKSKYRSSNRSILITCESVGGIGEALFDENGYITSFAIDQVEHYTSFVNGVPASSVTPEDGKTYEVTYRMTVPDLTEDGAYTYSDIDLFLMCLAGRKISADTTVADIDGDGKLTMRDLNRMTAALRYAIEKSNEPAPDPNVRIIGGKKYTLTFEDEFDGTSLNTRKWSYCPEWGRGNVGGYWENDMTSVRDGNLVLTVSTRSDGTLISGAVRTYRKFSQKGGYFEARIRTQTAPGFWGAFWLMDANMNATANNTAADGAEIDIMESFNLLRGGINHAIHWDGYNENHKATGKEVYDRAYYHDFHVYALEWTDSEYIFYIDGKETWRTSEPGMCEKALYIKLTTECGTWAGTVDKSKLPDEFLVDYVRVYQRAN